MIIRIYSLLCCLISKWATLKTLNLSSSRKSKAHLNTRIQQKQFKQYTSLDKKRLAHSTLRKLHKTTWEQNPQCGMCSVWQVIINCWQYNFSFDADLFFIKNNQGTFAWGGPALLEAGTFRVRWLLTYLPRAKHASCWGSQRVTSSSWSWGFCIKPRGFGSEGSMPQAVLLVRRCFTCHSMFGKWNLKDSGQLPEKQPLHLEGEVELFPRMIVSNLF